MTNKFQNQSKWLLLVIGLLFINQSFAYKNNLTEPILGQDASEARIEQGDKLFTANCASCHALKKKVVGPPLDGVAAKYDYDYTWLLAWIKDNSKLIKSGDERAIIASEYDPSAMNIFQNLKDDEITSILMFIENGGPGNIIDKGSNTPEVSVISDSLFSNINWAVLIMCILVFAIILLIFGILELVSNVTGKEIINWNNINAYMMLVFLIGFFGLTIYEYSIHYQYDLSQFGSASEHGVELDKMMRWTWIATLPVFFITQFLLFYFSFKYRRKPGRKAYFLSHNNNLEYVWTIIPAIVLAVLVSGGFKMWNKILRSDAGKDAQNIEVFAYQFGWYARYTGEDGELGKANFNLINGTNPLGVANRAHATELIDELRADILFMDTAIINLPKGLTKLQSTLGGKVGDERKKHLRKIKEYTSGDKLDDLEGLIQARNTQIERLQRALKVKKGNMFDGKGDDDQVVQEIHLVKDQPVKLRFRARDVIHSAYLPYFRTQMNVVPGLPTQFTFIPIKSTAEMRKIKGDPEFDYYLVCNKICGNAHFNMKMKVIVEDQKSYDKWISKQSALFTKDPKEDEGETDENTESTETETTETVASN
ncbi:MAG: hypothetical protein COA58_01855 [Bacteroidetes bacterium]|nr:MAG: hypothetical protein COA58_01855 [Bacteroidota bacterium]